MSNKDFSGLAVAPIPESFFPRKREYISQRWRADHVTDLATQIYVHSNIKNFKDGGQQVALSEVHESHPTGQVLIAGPAPVEVALTPAIVEKLNAGEIVECTPVEVLEGEATAKQKRLDTVESQKPDFRNLYLALYQKKTADDFEKEWPSIRDAELEAPRKIIGGVPVTLTFL